MISKYTNTFKYFAGSFERHWSGENSILQSIVIFDVLIKLFILYWLVEIDLTISALLVDHHPIFSETLHLATNVAFLMLGFIVMIWGMLGVWRASNARVQKSHKLASSIVKLYCVAMTLLITTGGIAISMIEPVGTNNDALCAVALKPVIYLYPTHREEVIVQLLYKGQFTTTYPKYDKIINGWNIEAYPDGHFINRSDNDSYNYIFWEGPTDKIKTDFSTGFFVRGEDAETFLKSTLRQLGLSTIEYNEFIVYWLPKLQSNKFNLIHFAGKEYTDVARLQIDPKPDSLLRIFMELKPVDKEVTIKPQEILPFERKGFTVVEWGGMEFK